MRVLRAASLLQWVDFPLASHRESKTHERHQPRYRLAGGVITRGAVVAEEDESLPPLLRKPAKDHCIFRIQWSLACYAIHDAFANRRQKVTLEPEKLGDCFEPFINDVLQHTCFHPSVLHASSVSLPPR